MKQLILALVVALPMLFSSAAFASKPLDAADKAIEREQTRFLVASSHQEQESSSEEEEEEPDCD